MVKQKTALLRANALAIACVLCVIAIWLLVLTTGCVEQKNPGGNPQLHQPAGLTESADISY